MRVRTLLPLLVATTVLLSGCDAIHGYADANNKLKAQSNEISKLQVVVSNLKEQVKQLKKEQLNLVVDNFMGKQYSSAYLTPGDSGYSVVSSNIGKLTVQMSNIKPYANGSKVTLKFGNPLAANITGLKVKLEWGSVNSKGMPNNESAKSKDFTFSKTLDSGAWTNVPVVLAGVPPSKLGFVRVQNVEHTGISLRR